MKYNNKSLVGFVGLGVKALLLSWLFVFSQAGFADSDYRVKPSDNLISIAKKQYEGSGLTRSQILVGIYASNPKSFKKGNINKLLKGQKLILPDAHKIDQISPHEAELVLSARTTKKKSKKRKSKKRVVKSRKSKKKSKRKSKPRKKVATRAKKKTNTQRKDIQKIDELEKEGESLKKRLETLLAERTARDSKLKELEKSLQDALKKTATVATVSAIVKPEKETDPALKKKESEVAEIEGKSSSEGQLVAQLLNKNLRAKNELLEKKLQESKKKINENSRASLVEEQAIKEAPSKVVESSTEQKQKAVEKEQVKATVKDESDEAKVAASTVASTTPPKSESSTFDISNKYLQWALLSLLLFPLIWFAKRFFKSKKAKEQPAWVTANDEQSGMLGTVNERIDTHYQDAPLESSIKLDVASAYLESGDTDEALQILNEIMLEGNEEQKAKAQALLESI